MAKRIIIIMPRTRRFKTLESFLSGPPPDIAWHPLLYISDIPLHLNYVDFSRFFSERLLKVLAIILFWMCLEKDAVHPVSADDRET